MTETDQKDKKRQNRLSFSGIFSRLRGESAPEVLKQDVEPTGFKHTVHGFMSPQGGLLGQDELEKSVQEKLDLDRQQTEEKAPQRTMSLGQMRPSPKKKLSFDLHSIKQQAEEMDVYESPKPGSNKSPVEPQEGENLRKFVTDKIVKEQEKTAPIKLTKTNSSKGSFFKIPLRGLRRGSDEGSSKDLMSKSLPNDGITSPTGSPRGGSGGTSPIPKRSSSLSGSPILKSFLGSKRGSEKQQAPRQFEENLPKCKVLLLGAGFAGKSTLFVQLQSILNKELDIPQFTAKIRYNCYQIAEILAKHLDLPYHPFQSIDWIDFLIEKDVRDKEKEKKIFKMLKDVMEFYKNNPKASELFIKTPYYFDGAEHFMKLETLGRVSQPNFVPGEEDYLLIRCKTIGITRCDFVLNGIQYDLIDVGGQQNERRKWKNCFQGVNVVIFVVSLSDFDEMVLNEGEGSNRMKEALSVFTLTVNGEVFTKTQFLILFNKEDVLLSKISKKDTLVDAFPEYSGGQNFENAKKFIVELFMSQINGDQSRFKPCVKKAISRDEIKEFLNNIEETAKQVAPEE